MNVTKKAKKEGLIPSSNSLRTAIAELQIYCDKKEALFMIDSIMSCCVGSYSFAVMEELAKADHFTYYNTLKSLIAAAFSKDLTGPDKLKRKGKK